MEWDGRKMPMFSRERVLVPQPLYRVTTKIKGKWMPQYVCTHPVGDCPHPNEALSTKGTNQFGTRIRCMACGELLQEQKVIKDHMKYYIPP